MKVLVISDSFKGTLTSKEIGQIATKVFLEKGYDCDYVAISDGGEGFVEAIEEETKWPYITVEARKPFSLDTSEARYVFDKESKTAYVELAEASGISKMERLNPFYANTFGTGEVIKHAITVSKAKRIIVGLGGSASVDMGAGMLEALGVLFFDENNNPITGLCNEKLGLVKRIDDSQMRNLVGDTEFVTMADVLITTFGPLGTIEMYAPQKGASKADIIKIIANCRVFLEAVENLYHYAPDFYGSGAAGGVSYALKYFLNSTTKSGIETFLEMIKFADIKDNYDVIVSGEGKYDNQTSQGKVIAGIRKYQPKRLVILTGYSEVEDFSEVYSIVPHIASFTESMINPKAIFEKLCRSLDFEKKNIGKILIALSGHTAAGKTSIGKYLGQKIDLEYISEGEIKRSFITNYNANDSLNEELRNKGYSCSIELAQEKIKNQTVLIDASFHKKERRKMLNDAFLGIDNIMVWLYCFCSDEGLVEKRINKRKTQVKTANNQADSMDVYYHIIQAFDPLNIVEMNPRSLIIKVDTAINQITDIFSNFEYENEDNIKTFLSVVDAYLARRKRDGQ